MRISRQLIAWVSPCWPPPPPDNIYYNVVVNSIRLNYNMSVHCSRHSVWGFLNTFYGILFDNFYILLWKLLFVKKSRVSLCTSICCLIFWLFFLLFKFHLTFPVRKNWLIIHSLAAPPPLIYMWMMYILNMFNMRKSIYIRLFNLVVYHILTRTLVLVCNSV